MFLNLTSVSELFSFFFLIVTINGLVYVFFKPNTLLLAVISWKKYLNFTLLYGLGNIWTMDSQGMLGHKVSFPVMNMIICFAPCDSNKICFP